MHSKEDELKKATQLKNKAALEGNQAFKFILPKYGRQQIMKDG